MQRLTVVLCCGVLLAGCASLKPPVPSQAEVPEDFTGRQKYLFTQTDADAVYRSCQQLMQTASQLQKEGKASTDHFFPGEDMPPANNDLPKPILDLAPTAVAVSP